MFDTNNYVNCIIFEKFPKVWKFENIFESCVKNTCNIVCIFVVENQ